VPPSVIYGCAQWLRDSESGDAGEWVCSASRGAVPHARLVRDSGACEQGRLAVVAVVQMTDRQRELEIGDFKRGSNTVGPWPERKGGLSRFNLGLARGRPLVVVGPPSAADWWAEPWRYQIRQRGRTGVLPLLALPRHP